MRRGRLGVVAVPGGASNAPISNACQSRFDSATCSESGIRIRHPNPDNRLVAELISGGVRNRPNLIDARTSGLLDGGQTGSVQGTGEHAK